MVRGLSLVGLVSVFSGTLFSAPADVPVRGESSMPRKNFVVLGHFDGQSDKDLSIITARLSEKLSVKNLIVEEHGTFLQIILPDTIVPKPAEFIEVKSPIVDKIAAFQVSPSDAALRLFVNREASKVKPAAVAEIVNDRVIITIDHAALVKDTPVMPAVTEESVVTKTVAADTTAENPSPAAIIKTNVNTQPSTAAPLAIGENVIDLSGRLTGAAIFSAVMILGLLGFYTVRALLRRRRHGSQEQEPFDMRTLATFPLMAKQRLALIEVCNEKILLAISPDQVSYITTLGGRRDTEKKSYGAAVNLAPLPMQKMTQQLTTIPKMPPPLAPAAAGGLSKSPKSPVSHAALAKGPVSTARPTTETQESMLTTPRKRINISIGDDGIHKAKDLSAQKNEHEQDGPKAISDVTKLIREKLKNLSAL